MHNKEMACRTQSRIAPTVCILGQYALSAFCLLCYHQTYLPHLFWTLGQKSLYQNIYFIFNSHCFPIIIAVFGNGCPKSFQQSVCLQISSKFCTCHEVKGRHCRCSKPNTEQCQKMINFTISSKSYHQSNQ